MKNLKIILGFALVAVMIFFSSCGKEDIALTDETTSELVQENEHYIKGYGKVELNKEYFVKDFKGTEIYEGLKEPNVDSRGVTEDWRILVRRDFGSGSYQILTPNNYSVIADNNGYSMHNLLHPNNYPDCDWTYGVRIRVSGNDRFNVGTIFLIKMYNQGASFHFVHSTSVYRILGGETRYYKYREDCYTPGPHPTDHWDLDEYDVLAPAPDEEISQEF